MAFNINFNLSKLSSVFGSSFSNLFGKTTNTNNTFKNTSLSEFIETEDTTSQLAFGTSQNRKSSSFWGNLTKALSFDKSKSSSTFSFSGSMIPSSKTLSQYTRSGSSTFSLSSLMSSLKSSKATTTTSTSSTGTSSSSSGKSSTAKSGSSSQIGSLESVCQLIGCTSFSESCVTYDDQGRVSKIDTMKEDYGIGVVANSGKIYQFQYNDDGGVTVIEGVTFGGGNFDCEPTVKKFDKNSKLQEEYYIPNEMTKVLGKDYAEIAKNIIGVEYNDQGEVSSFKYKEDEDDSFTKYKISYEENEYGSREISSIISFVHDGNIADSSYGFKDGEMTHAWEHCFD